MKKFYILLVVCLTLFMFTACANQTDTDVKEADVKETEQAKTEKLNVNLVIATGGTSGSYFPMGGAIANIISNNIEGINASAQTSGGSIENLKLLNSGEVELALAQNDLADYAMKGIEVFDKKLDKIRAIASLYPEYIHIAVDPDSGINSISDMKNKKISVGAPGSGSEANCRQFLELLGVPYDSFKPQFLSNTDAADQFKDNIIDGMIITTGLPSPAIMEIATTKGVKVIGFSEEEANKISSEWPFLTPIAIQANTYEGQTEEIITMAAKSVLFTSIDIPEDVIYEVTKALWEKQPELAKANAKAEFMDKDDPVNAVTVPVHSGALKYYNEIGLDIK